ncbi:double-strand break repair protein MRE11 [Drosophila willistoni]|uniref:double-strand break repair protein MRE11 n=1 Tax=Drosophila willistoni TaxID=7260 RepID=UPI001F07578B|nr:double-strand break repair protein MRE11 [Drosophila willistoni]
MTNTDGADKDVDNVIRIMVSTDNHLGYLGSDSIRGEDSFVAFEEMLQLAVSEDVDMILLGGDLFHDAVPNQYTLHKCLELLRRYTFGDKPVSLEILSDQSRCFYNAVNESVNYEDPNLNISLPVFSIHGNHDDPSGFGRLSSLDLLSTAGCVNYYGRWTDLTKLEISPVLLRKGESHLALYGLSHIPDQRLSRLFEEFKVTMQYHTEKSTDQSAEDEESNWFHLMVVHQNRADRGRKRYLPEELLPSFLNLVIWGHEHDCRIEPELNVKRDFYVTQPGSSVPTSLAEGESIKKHVGLLEIYKNKFQLKPLPLKTVRPFIFESINLNDMATELGLDEGDAKTKVKKFAREKIEEMIERSKDRLTGHPKQPEIPLIRLRLLYSDESYMFNTIRFGQEYSSRVANPADIIYFKKLNKHSKAATINLDKEAMKKALEMENTTRVEELVDRYFDEAQGQRPLKLLHSKALAEITFRLVERHDANAADNIVKFYRDKAVDHLMDALPDDENIDIELENFRHQHNHEDLLKMLDARGVKKETIVPKNEANKTAASVANTSTRTAATAPARGRGTRGRTAAVVKPQLDVSIETSATRSSGRKQTLLSAVGRNSRSKVASYVISDDSD